MVFGEQTVGPRVPAAHRCGLYGFSIAYGVATRLDRRARGRGQHGSVTERSRGDGVVGPVAGVRNAASTGHEVGAVIDEQHLLLISGFPEFKPDRSDWED